MTDIEKIKDDIDKTKKLIKEMELIGGKMPKLKAALDRFEIAINTGGDIAAAAKETSEYLKLYTSDLKKACGDDVMCNYEINRKYQQRAVNYVFSMDKKNSVVSNTIRHTLRRYMPELICKRLEACK